MNQRLPLFPLQTVLFPDGLLHLRVFEARYLDLMADCLREQAPFGVVCLRQGAEVRHGQQPVQLEDIATLARLDEVDAEQAGILRVTCRGGQRVRLRDCTQRDDGLWTADFEALPDDARLAPPPPLQAAVAALANAIGSLAAQGQRPFAAPHRLDDAGWVANRWCEILPIPLAAKQRLMALDEPLLRLKLVHEFLQGRGVL